MIVGPHLGARARPKEDQHTSYGQHKNQLPNYPIETQGLVAGLKELVSVKKLITLALRGDTEKLLW